MNDRAQIRVITYGTFDMLHQGHVNIIKKAREEGDYLVIGVTSDDYDRSRGKLNVSQTVDQRIAAIEKLEIADKVIMEDHKGQKQEDIQRLNIDKFVIGDDWLGKFDYLNEFCEVIYRPRTEGISSTELRKAYFKTIRLGIVGTGRIASRFVDEAAHVGFLNIRAVMSRSKPHVKEFADRNGIKFGYTDFDDLLKSSIDAIYIATPHENHFKQAKQALLAGKHVLCEKPICLRSSELAELTSISKSNGLILMEAIKTAYFQGFSKILEAVDSGKIGEIQDVRASFSKLIGDRGSREWKTPFGGAFNELASYPLLLATKLLGRAESTQFIKKLDNGVDAYTTIVNLHAGQKTSILNVGIGVKTKGCAIISGTKGYVYVQDPWWLTKIFSIHGEDPTISQTRAFDLDGDGLRYEIAEFLSLIRKGQTCSQKHDYLSMRNICEIFDQFNFP